MLANILSYGLYGIEGFLVHVEVDITNGLPSYDTVGLPDAAVKESKDRVRSAIKNSGYEFPPARMTVSLAPADRRKEGPLYDLPIALGILTATGQTPGDIFKDTILLGELALNGDVRPIQGLLPMVIDAQRRGIKNIVIPLENAKEINFLDGLNIYGVGTLREIAEYMRGDGELTRVEMQPWQALHEGAEAQGVDIAMVRGQQNAKRALEIAASGSHNALFIGIPGSGKTMLARCAPSILPDLTFEEAMQITQIHSVAGLLRHTQQGVLNSRPFRAPHHSISIAALTGGGSKAMPGEISLAHGGCLMLDELSQYGRSALESLRQPLEDGVVTVSRVNATVTYPARFMLIASMNPCPCGYYGSPQHECHCTPLEIKRYLSKLSGPLLDRLDLQVEMPAVPYDQLTDNSPQEDSQTVRRRVVNARAIQQRRFEGTAIYANAQMNAAQIKEYCILEPSAEALLKQAYTQMGMSARGHARILKVARTIADLAGQDKIRPEHVAEAVQYRSLDKKYWER